MCRLLAALHRPGTLAFLIDGFARLLSARLTADSSYLPSSISTTEGEQEMVILLWNMVTVNQPFVTALLASPALPEIVISLCHLIFSLVDDVGSAAILHLAILSLLALSGAPEFATAVNEQCPTLLPSRHPFAAPASAGTMGDLLLGTVAAVVTHPSPEEAAAHPLASLFSAALALVANIAPHVKVSAVSPPPRPTVETTRQLPDHQTTATTRHPLHGRDQQTTLLAPRPHTRRAQMPCPRSASPFPQAWSPFSAKVFFKMLSALSSPPLLCSSEGSPEALLALLEALSSSLHHTHQSNTSLVHAILANAPLVHSLLAMPLSAALSIRQRSDQLQATLPDGADPADPADGFVPTAEWMSAWQARPASLASSPHFHTHLPRRLPTSLPISPVISSHPRPSPPSSPRVPALQ